MMTSMVLIVLGYFGGLGDGKVASEEYNALSKPKYDIVFTNTSNSYLIIPGMEFNVKKIWFFSASAVAFGTFPPSVVVPVELDPNKQVPYRIRCPISPVLQVAPDKQDHIQVHYTSKMQRSTSTLSPCATVYQIETFLILGNGQAVSLGDSLIFIKNAQSVYEMDWSVEKEEQMNAKIPQQFREMVEEGKSRMEETTKHNRAVVQDLLKMPKLVKANPVLDEFLKTLDKERIAKITAKGQETMYDKRYP